jgi:endonuclease-8
MYGTWHVYKPGDPWQRPEREARLVLEVEDAVVVNFSAPVIELLEERALAVHVPIAGLGPDLLDDAFDAPEAFRRFRARADLTIGDAIMDQRVMAGVGNIWKHETLFRCGVHPWRLVSELDDETLGTIIETARQLLRASVGKTNTRGIRGRPVMYAYGRAGKPCRRCDTIVRSAPQGQDIRQTAWCPRCQPEAPGQAVLPVPRRRTLPVRDR